ncbi:lactonase family protein [Amycolatopsis roodepoortensis]|uniref:6-phosphogluconolactonase (Cycloisomerase 2 family) n=1 Tax=Amycolatopsis roodepoortensis TaxID=700274 RepID=A0ABR9L9I7_9PSEU|nr:lactonase family protein [Amycolatopsis roodepoortensis]MBE1577344.1 6-phosphogluconolactonase (cycloisomerase 2 family) [Amycolatopsis roodepoortensis]
MTSANEDRTLLIAGSYTAASGGKGEGIGTFWRDARTGELTPAGSLALDSPSWLTPHPTLPVLYAVNETAEGAITAVAVAEDGTLSALNSLPTGGADPCHLAVTPDGRYLLCANYSGGSLAAFALGPDGVPTVRTALVQHEGSGPDTERQESAHVHMAVVDESGTLVSAIDLGADEIRSYRLGEEGELIPVSVSTLPAGTGPRQLVRRPGTNHAYVVGELAASLVTVREEPPGTFAVENSVNATREPGGPNLPAQLVLHEDRLFLSNRGPERITEFTFDGVLPQAVDDHPTGAWPRHFSIAGEHCYVASQNTDAIQAYERATWRLIGSYPVGSPAFIGLWPH